MSTFKIQPVGDRLVVRQAAVEEKTESGIFLPGTASSNDPVSGEVLAVGEGRRASDGTIIPMTVGVGDVVLFQRGNTLSTKATGEECLFLSESSVLGILRK